MEPGENEMTTTHAGVARTGTHSYALAGFMAIASAVLSIPETVLGFACDVRSDLLGFVLPILILITVAEMGLGIYAILRFRHLLNHRYQFHKADTLILLWILGGVVITAMMMTGRVFATIAMKIAMGVSVAAIGIPVGILGIVLGLTLLKLNGDLHGLLRPMAYALIGAGACFAAVIPAIFGLFLLMAFTFMLGIALLRADEAEEEVDFV